MTAIAAISLIGAFTAGLASFITLIDRLAFKRERTQTQTFGIALAYITLCLAPIIAHTSFIRTMGEAQQLAEISLFERDITSRPIDWNTCTIARREALAAFLDREGMSYDNLEAHMDPFPDGFINEWIARRGQQIRSIGNHDLSWSDLRKANMQSTFAVGVELPPDRMLRGATVSLSMFEGTDFYNTATCRVDIPRLVSAGVSFREAQFSGGNLSEYNFSKADLTQADLSGTQMEGVNFDFAILRGAKLNGANLNFSRLAGAKLEQADLRSTQLSFTDFTGARATGANFGNATMAQALMRWAQMEDAIMNDVELTEASLRNANLSGVDFFGARLTSTDLTGAQMQRASLEATLFLDTALTDTNLSAATNFGGALRLTDLTNVVWNGQTDFRNAFLDGSVSMTDAFRRRMGAPCQWLQTTLEESEFFSVWAWWQMQLVGGVTNALSLSEMPTEARIAELGLTDCEPNQPFGPMPKDAPVTNP
ncbi:MAG: pentapeptide repeat-containing protein [Paracoccaceae bacterium]|nr:pentapeptide repeat-containing protein [Paracoccaceae bacterium]